MSIGGTLQELAWLAQRGVPIPILEKLEANRTTVTTRLTESEMRSMGALVIDDSVSAPAETRIIQPGEDFNRAPQRRYTPPVQFLKN